MISFYFKRNTEFEKIKNKKLKKFNIFGTLAYSELRHIRNFVDIQNPRVFKSSTVFRSLSNIF